MLESKGLLYLAPMEGVVDYVMRDQLTAIGGIDRCVTEFIRVTDQLLPDHIFLKYCPELKSGSRTRTGTPVYVQLLGGHPEPLAENARRAVELGAIGIDLNFGCPAKTVNRHDGGATLLKYPDRIFRILSAVRASVPRTIPVTAKIRLGFDNPEMCIPNAEAVESAGIELLTVHCRTKTDMYKPPAFWEWIPKIKAKTKLRIVANGEIWSVDDLKRCREITGCDDFMIGRGALANPLIFRQIRGENISVDWPQMRNYLAQFFELNIQVKNENYALSRSKQWLNQMRKSSTEAAEAFEILKAVNEAAKFRSALLKLPHLSVDLNC
jgi:tRNA-dihydrouridine synthase C